MKGGGFILFIIFTLIAFFFLFTFFICPIDFKTLYKNQLCNEFGIRFTFFYDSNSQNMNNGNN